MNDNQKVDSHAILQCAPDQYEDQPADATTPKRHAKGRTAEVDGSDRDETAERPVSER